MGAGQVGKDQKAQAFLATLDKDPEIGAMVDATRFLPPHPPYPSPPSPFVPFHNVRAPRAPSVCGSMRAWPLARLPTPQ